MHDAQTDDVAGLFRDFQVDDALAAASLCAVFIRLCAFAKAFRRNGENFGCGIQRIHTDDRVAFYQPDALDAARRASHRANIVLIEDNRHAPLRAKDDVVMTVRKLDADEFVVFVKIDGDQTALAKVLKLF